MRYLAYTFAYLRLRRSDRSVALTQDLLYTTIVLLIIVIPFLYLDGSNFFAKDGFLEKFGDLTSALTGFYIAGLLAVVTFASKHSALDETIAVGRVYIVDLESKNLFALSRRQYVSYLFGYLSMLSLFISVLSSYSLGVSSAISDWLAPYVIDIKVTHINLVTAVAVAAKVLITGAIAHLIVTTAYGMYYLVYKIYDRVPLVLPSPSVKSLGPEEASQTPSSDDFL